MTDEERIARYRAELAEEAGMAAADLDEIEDHLRELVRELRSFDAAVARLGAARDLAREHARVRGAFGVAVSGARAWGAAAIFGAMLVAGTIGVLRGHLSLALLGIVAVGLLLVGGLVAGRSWARPMLLGVVAINLFFYARTSLPLGPVLPFVAGFVALAVLLAPRRFADLTRAGWALAAIGAAYAGAVVAFELALRGIVPASGVFVGLAELVGFIGILLRARWGSVALAVGAVGAAHVALGGFLPYEHGETAVLMAAAAYLSWRDARHGAGTLRAFLA